MALNDSENRLNQWLKNGMHGEMDYMERNQDKTIDPTLLVPNAKSVVSVLLSYFPGNPEISKNPPKISRYALGPDYHTTIKMMLLRMLDMIRQEVGPASGRAFVDSAPVLEREWAVKSGLGWIGKNSLLIHPKFGSYIFIGELIIDLEIEPSTHRVPNRCGNCTKCIDTCPTGAIVAPYTVDARKCISYLTIEKKNHLTEEEESSLNGWCFGCDTCQEVCPWNNKIHESTFPQLSPKKEITSLNTEKISALTEREFGRIFGETPVSRAGFESFLLNCQLASN
jgi:epoxyqueuosine reductase